MKNDAQANPFAMIKMKIRAKDKEKILKQENVEKKEKNHRQILKQLLDFNLKLTEEDL